MQVSVYAGCRVCWPVLVFIELDGPTERVQGPDEGGELPERLGESEISCPRRHRHWPQYFWKHLSFDP